MRSVNTCERERSSRAGIPACPAVGADLRVRPALSHIALDATPLSVPLAGIGRYTAELARHLAAAHPESQVTLLSDQPFMEPAGPPNLHSDPRPARAWERRWWSVGLPLRLRRLRASLFHGTDFAVPFYASSPAVLTIHDLAPFRFPHNPRVARRLPGAARRARAIIVPSERMKQEVVAELRLPDDKVFVTPLAAASCFRPGSASVGRQRPYVLFVGTIEPRKNLVRLLNAFARLNWPDVKLVLAGRRAWGWEEVEARIHELGLQSRVEIAGHVPDEELADLYRGAAVFVYPSLYEGFGLPVLEAMACGAPVVTSKDTAPADVCGDAAWLVDPHSEEEIREAIEATLKNPTLAATLGRRGLARAAEFSWTRTAELTWQVYESALSGS